MPLESKFCISTPRLNIHYFDPFNNSHCNFLVQLTNSPELAAVNKQMRRGGLDREAARTVIESGVEKLAKTGYGRYAISLKASNELVGDQPPETSHHEELVGIVSMLLDRFPGAPTVPDVGFNLLAKYYGKGYATEAAQGLLAYFENVKGQTEFAGYCSPDNESSKNVFRRLGFEERGVRDISGVVSEDTKLKALVWTKGLTKPLDEYRI